MRGDALLAARLLARPRGLAGVAAVVAGGAALTAAYLPWYEVAAEIVLLDNTETQTVATLPGWQAHPWNWLVPVLAVVAVLAGASVAIDHPVPRAASLHLGAGLGLAVVAGTAAFLRPPVYRFDMAGTRLRDLAGVADRLPRDVDLTFSVQTGRGLWVTVAAAVVITAIGLTLAYLR